MAKSKKQPKKKDRELLDRLHRNLGIALDSTVQRIVDAKEDIPAALAGAGVSYLKLHGIADDLEREAIEEATESASATFVSRLAPQWIDSMLNYDEPSSLFAGIPDTDYEAIIRKARTEAEKLDPESAEHETLQQVIRAAEARQQRQQ
jgi:hypothetical protein